MTQTASVWFTPSGTRKEDKLPLQAFREALLSSCSGDDALFGTLDDASWCNVGVSENGGTPKWMVYNGKSHFLMDDIGATIIFGNTHVYTLVN